MSLMRTRWAAIGAAVAVTLGGGGIAIVSATSPAEAVTFVPITPCRVIDTRPGNDNVGPRSTPIGAAQTHAVDAVADTGAAGDCSGVLPTTATAVSMNVTALDATAPTFLTIWDGSLPRPTASALNPTPGQPPTPNAVTTELTAGGEFSVFNLTGSVHFLADIVGYYVDHHHDDRYYTKSQSDGRYYTKTQADDRFELATSGAEAAFTYEAIGSAPTVAEVTVDTPSIGYVIVNVQGQAQNPFVVGTGQATCSITNGTTVESEHRIFSGVLGVGDFELLSGTRAFAVPAIPLSRQRTYRFVCFDTGGFNFANVHLNAVFVPDSDARSVVRGG